MTHQNQLKGLTVFSFPSKSFGGGRGGRREGGGEGGREGEGGGGRRVTLAGWTIFFHVNTSSRPLEMRELNRKCVRRPYVKETTVQFCLYFSQGAHAFLCILRFFRLGRKTRSVSMLLRPPKFPDWSPLPKVAPWKCREPSTTLQSD